MVGGGLGDAVVEDVGVVVLDVVECIVELGVGVAVVNGLDFLGLVFFLYVRLV